MNEFVITMLCFTIAVLAICLVIVFRKVQADQAQGRHIAALREQLQHSADELTKAVKQTPLNVAAPGTEYPAFPPGSSHRRK